MFTKVKLHYQVIIGAVLGVSCGLLMGKSAAFFNQIGEIYIRLLQAVVYPYIICTLIGSLGEISPKLSYRLFRKGVLIYLLLVIFVFIFLAALVKAIPTSIFVSLHKTEIINMLQEVITLTIPNNFIAAIVKNYIPAVILFCVIFGLALQHYEKKQTLISVLLTVRETSSKLLHWIIYIRNVSGHLRQNH